MSGLELRYTDGYAPLEKTCPCCGETKPISEFPRVYNNRWIYCQPCHRAKKTEYMRRHRAKKKAAQLTAQPKPKTILERYKCRQQSTKS